MSLLKPSITGIAGAHPLAANLTALWDIGGTDTDIVSGTALTTTAPVAYDADIGQTRLITSTNNGFSESILFNQNNTIVFIFKTDAEDNSSIEVELMDGNDPYNEFYLRLAPFTGFDFEYKMRADAGGTYKDTWNVFADTTALQAPHALAVTSDTTGGPSLVIDGLFIGQKTAVSPVGFVGGAQLHHLFGAVSSAVVTTKASAVFVFDKVLTQAEAESFTANPWAIVDGSFPPVVSVNQADLPLTPGGTISGTYSNYATVPTTLTVSDGTNTITIANPGIVDDAAGGGTFSGTMPALPTTGTANLVLFGNVTVSLT